jgi:hypothetical protein
MNLPRRHLPLLASLKRRGLLADKDTEFQALGRPLGIQSSETEDETATLYRNSSAGIKCFGR